MIKPIFTEKSTKLARLGKYSFFVSSGVTKLDIKSQVSNLFGVTVTGVRTLKIGFESKRNVKGFKVTKNATKKAIITLKEGEKIDIFEEKK